MFKDDDIVEVYYGKGWTLENQEYLGKDKFYQGASRLVHLKLESLGIMYPLYIRQILVQEDLTIIDYGSHSHFFKLKRL